MRIVRLAGVLVVIVIGSSASTLAADQALATDDARSFDVEFSAPAECPGRQSFVEQVLARTSRARASAEVPEYRFSLTITNTERGPRGELAIHGADGVDSRREVPAETCDSVVEAAALIAALVLDPQAATGSLRPSTGALPAAPAGDQARDWPKPPPTEAVFTEAAREPAAERSGMEPPSRSRGLRLGVAAAATVHSGIAPTVAPGAAFGLLVLDPSPTVFAPALGADGEFASATAVRSELGTASFTWLAGRLWGCPLRYQSTSFALRPCASFDAGFVRARGDEAFRARTQTAPWVAAGPLARLDWMASRIASFVFQAGAVFPLSRDSYVFLPDDVVHEVPVVALSASVGAALWLN